MAISGSFNTGSYSDSGITRYLTFKWERTSYSIADNTSTISWSLVGSGSSGYMMCGGFKVVIDGETVYSVSQDTRIKVYVGTICASGTKTIKHNADGGRSFSASAQAGIWTWAVNKSGSGSWALDTIPRQAHLTAAPNFNDEQNPTITYSNPAGNAVESLQACITNDSGGLQYIKYRDIPMTGTSYQFVLTDAERNVLRAATPNSNTLTVRFYIKTVIGGESYFSNAQKILSIVNANPIVTASATDTNSATVALTGDSTKFIKYHSNVLVSINATAQKSAVITSTSGSGTYENVEVNTWTVRAIDSRGNSTVQSPSGTLIPYIRLTCNLGNDIPNTSGNMTVRCSGNYFNGSFGAVNNTLTVQYRYKVHGGSYGSWNTMSVTTDGNTYNATASLSGLSYQETYVFQARAVDKLMTASTDENAVKSLPIFHWGKEDFVFEVPVTFNAGVSGAEIGGGSSTSNDIEGDCNITGNLRLKGSGNYGNALYFGDGSYCYLKEDTDDDLTIKASDLNINVSSLLFNNRTIVYGEWTPTLGNSSAVSSYSVRKGWYQKLGSVVTIGWQIKATCNSGYSSTSISISGLPFTPTNDASGGGICSGAYVSAGFNFECWVASTGGTITARVQSCNNTSAANLSTSASGLFYRNSGGEITLGGTICYLTSG